MALNLTHCTLTGVDETTSLEDIVRLSKSFPMAEWGFLYSPKRQGQPGRYPAIATLIRAFQSLPPHVRIAMHVCGDGVHNLLAGHETERQLLDLVSKRGGRIQLNFNQIRKPVSLDEMAKLLSAYSSTTFITQENAANQAVWRGLAEAGASNHAVLFDSSGGQGVSCAEWPQPLPIPCGYAGGLGPQNIQEELGRISAAVSNRPTWVDMEGKLRRHDENGVDWFDLDACVVCLTASQDHVSRAQNHFRRSA